MSSILAATVIRPLSDDRVEIISGVTGRRVVVTAANAMRLVMDGSGDLIAQLSEKLGLNDVTAEDEATVTHWFARNWQEALSTYTASRHVRYADVGPDFEATQQGVVDEYQHEDSLPTYSPRDFLSCVALPAPPAVAGATVGEILERRMSTPNPPQTSMTLAELSLLLDGAFADARTIRRISDPREPGEIFRSFATAIDCYVTVFNVPDLAPGIYEYAIADHELHLLAEGDFRERLSAAMIGQAGPRRAPLTISLVAEFERYQWRYRHERAMRVLWGDSARLVSGILLHATLLGRKMQLSPAARDSDFLELLGLDRSRWQGMYNVSVG